MNITNRLIILNSGHISIIYVYYLTLVMWRTCIMLYYSSWKGIKSSTNWRWNKNGWKSSNNNNKFEKSICIRNGNTIWRTFQPMQWCNNIWLCAVVNDKFKCNFPYYLYNTIFNSKYIQYTELKRWKKERTPTHKHTQHALRTNKIIILRYMLLFNQIFINCSQIQWNHKCMSKKLKYRKETFILFLSGCVHIFSVMLDFSFFQNYDARRLTHFNITDNQVHLSINYQQKCGPRVWSVFRMYAVTIFINFCCASLYHSHVN